MDTKHNKGFSNGYHRGLLEGLRLARSLVLDPEGKLTQAIADEEEYQAKK